MVKSKEHFSESISCRYPHNALSSNRCFDNTLPSTPQKRIKPYGQDFPLAAYKKLFHDGTIMNALYTTVILAAYSGRFYSNDFRNARLYWNDRHEQKSTLCDNGSYKYTDVKC